MRVLMLTQFYAPITGGEERHVQDLSLALTARGHHVAIATLAYEGCPAYEVDRGVHVHRLGGTLQRAKWLFKEDQRRHVPPLPDPELTLKLRQLIALERPDIIHAHNWMIYSFLPLKQWSRAKLIATLHDYSLQCAKKRMMFEGRPCTGPALDKCLNCSREHYGLIKGSVTALGNWFMSSAERSAVDMFLAVSHATADGNGLHEANNTPVRVIPNFVSERHNTQPIDIRPYLAQLPPDGYLLFVGDLSREKGIKVLLRAYAGLKQAPPLVLIGRRFPETPVELPPHVHILDSWPHQAVMEAWRRCSIALTPSIWPEPFGIVAIEAMACGRPVIASDIGGLRDIVIDGETGLRVPPGDEIALRHAIERLLADPALCRRFGEAGRRHVAEYQAGAIVPRIEDVYWEVLGIRAAHDQHHCQQL
jgi:glycosyltransferase involved in cell wall biosynthesis